MRATGSHAEVMVENILYRHKQSKAAKIYANMQVRQLITDSYRENGDKLPVPKT